MVTLTVIYPFDAERPFDEAYYAATHIPLIREVWGEWIAEIHVHHALAPLGDAPAFSTMTQIEFGSMEAFQAAMAAPRSAEVRADVSKFSDVTPLRQLSRRL